MRYYVCRTNWIYWPPDSKKHACFLFCSSTQLSNPAAIWAKTCQIGADPDKSSLVNAGRENLVNSAFCCFSCPKRRSDTFWTSGDFSDSCRDVLEAFRGAGARAPRRHFPDFIAHCSPRRARETCGAARSHCKKKILRDRQRGVQNVLFPWGCISYCKVSL